MRFPLEIRLNHLAEMNLHHFRNVTDWNSNDASRFETKTHDPITKRDPEWRPSILTDSLDSDLATQGRDPASLEFVLRNP